MALYTPPSQSGSGQNNNKNSPNKRNDSSSSSSPLGSNGKHTNPSFGLSLWGPLVPASDCTQCLCSLATWQLGVGFFFWMVPARHAFNKDFYYTAREAQSHRPSNMNTPSPSAGSSKGVNLPPSFTSFSKYKPNSGANTLPPQYPQYSQPSRPRFAEAMRPPPSSPSKILGMKFARVACLMVGGYLIFESGLEYVRLGLTYDPWVEDAAEARRAANAELAANHTDRSKPSPKVSLWFGPEDYTPVPYSDWKRRVDQYFERKPSFSKGSVFGTFFGSKSGSPSNGIPPDPNHLPHILNLLISHKIATRLRAIEVLESLKNVDKNNSELNDALYVNITNEWGLDNVETPPNGIGGPSPTSEPEIISSSSGGLVPSKISRNPVDDDLPLTKEEEAELEALKPKSPAEIDPIAGIHGAWEMVEESTRLLFCPINHYIPVEVSMRHIQEENLQKQKDQESEKKAYTFIYKLLNDVFGFDLDYKTANKSQHTLESAKEFSKVDWSEHGNRRIKELCSDIIHSLNWEVVEQRGECKLTPEQRSVVENVVIDQFVRAAIESTIAETNGQSGIEKSHLISELEDIVGSVSVADHTLDLSQKKNEKNQR